MHKFNQFGLKNKQAKRSIPIANGISDVICDVKMGARSNTKHGPRAIVFAEVSRIMGDTNNGYEAISWQKASKAIKMFTDDRRFL